MAINETHDPNLRSWVESANDPNTDFPIQNLPFGMFKGTNSKKVASVLGRQSLCGSAECGKADFLPTWQEFN